MFKHNLLTLLKEFTGEELKKFESFLKSPYHNKSRKVIQIFKEIKKFYPEFTNKKLSKEYLGRKINPSLKYHDSTLRDLMSDLLKNAEEFLTYEELKKGNSGKVESFLRTLIDKKQIALFEKHLRRLNNELDKNGIDSNYFYSKSRLDLNKFNFNIINRKKKSSTLIESNERIIISYIVFLLNYFLTEVINAHLNLLIYESKFKLKNDINIVSKIFNDLNVYKVVQLLENINDHNYILEIYSNLFYTFQDFENEKNYSKYKLLFLKYSKFLSKDEKAFHFSMLISYCIYKTSMGKSKSGFDAELFNLYEIFLTKKFFIDNKTKYLEEDLFRNILLTALRIKKYKWTLNFVKTFSKYIHPEKKKNLLNFSYAEVYYQIGIDKKSNKYLKKAFDFLKNIQEESFIVKYDIKGLYLILYYELGYYEAATTQINNYKKFLIRNKFVTGNKKIKINKFLNLYEKLIYFKEGDRRIDVDEVHSEILNSQYLDNRDWLLTKVKEIESGFKKRKAAV